MKMRNNINFLIPAIILIITLISLHTSAKDRLGFEITAGITTDAQDIGIYFVGGRFIIKPKPYINLGVSANYGYPGSDSYYLFGGGDVEFYFFSNEPPSINPFLHFEGGYLYSKTKGYDRFYYQHEYYIKTAWGIEFTSLKIGIVPFLEHGLWIERHTHEDPYNHHEYSRKIKLLIIQGGFRF